MMSEIASVQSVVKKKETRKKAKKRPELFQSKTFLIEKISSSSSSFLLLNPEFFTPHKIFSSLSLFDRCTFLEECFCVRFFLCICASELEELFVVSNETRRCLRRRAKWCCRCCCPPPPPPREDDNTTEEFYEDGSVTRAGVATTMKTTTTMGI